MRPLPGKMAVMIRGISFVRARAAQREVACAVSALVFLGCNALAPVSPDSELRGHSTRHWEVVLAHPCQLPLPSGKMGRPNTHIRRLLPAGRYLPSFEEEAGVYFQADAPLTVVRPEGPRKKPGGLFLGRDPAKLPEAYFGHDGHISERIVLPSGCPAVLQPAEEEGPP